MYQRRTEEMKTPEDSPNYNVVSLATIRPGTTNLRWLSTDAPPTNTSLPPRFNHYLGLPCQMSVSHHYHRSASVPAGRG
jgi:hypothetical protein